MNVEALKASVQNLVSSFFADGEVYFAEQNMSTPHSPYITLKFGNFVRVQSEVKHIDTSVSLYETDKPNSCDMEMNLYTQGQPFYDTYKNTCVSDMMDFIDYLESDRIIDWMETNNIYIQVNRDSVRDLSELRDVQYRYRCIATFRIYYVSELFGQYNQGNKVVPNASGGGKQSYSGTSTDWFESAEIEEET